MKWEVPPGITHTPRDKYILTISSVIIFFAETAQGTKE